MDNAKIAELVYRHTGLSAQQFPDEYDGCAKLVRAVVDEIAASETDARQLQFEMDRQATIDIWAAATTQAAMYVSSHCVDGERHADAIVRCRRPTIYMLPATTGSAA